MGSLLISHKTEPILELNNALKTFPHFTKEETESERRKVVKGFIWESDGQHQLSCDLRQPTLEETELIIHIRWQ